MRFAEFVLNDIAENGCNIAHGFMSEDFIVNSKREKGQYGYTASTGKDEWNLRVTYPFLPFIRKAYLSRGPQCVKIVLTKEEHKKLIVEWDQCFALQKWAKGQAKLARLAEEKLLQDWP